jgi:hypothetical protein
MAVDLMHDVELGVGKAISMHIFRLLMAEGGGAIEEFDARSVLSRAKTFTSLMRAQLSTGPNVRSRHDPEIWRKCFFVEEDDRKRFRGHHPGEPFVKCGHRRKGLTFLQCWMPVLEGLLPEPHNKAILDLAFDLSTWHAYAKLRKQTEYTIRLLRSQTKELGRQLRHFTNNTCSQYDTKPLPSEEAARTRRRAAKGKKRSQQATSGGSATEDGPDIKRFNMATYKIHALGDYADHIEQFGPTDCFTTQHVCHQPFSSLEKLNDLL